jgi:hypothetical protein
MVLGILISAISSAQSTTPPREPAIVAIDAAIKSLRETPNQFVQTGNMTGVSSTGCDAGTGIQVSLTGGGPGSTSPQQLALARQGSNDAIKQQADKAVQILTEIKTLIQKPAAQVDKAQVTSKLGELSRTYIAPVVVSVITALIKSGLGL